MLQKTTTKTNKGKKKKKPIVLKKYIRENWFKGCMILLLLFVLIKKDISFQIDMQNQTPTVSQESPTLNPTDNSLNQKPKAAPVKQSSKVDEMSMFGFLKGVASNVTTATKAEPKKEAPKPKKTNEVKAANNFANVSAILVTDFAKRYDITQKEVDERKATCEAYVKRFSTVAVSEMQRYGVPASITLAQGILESDAGTSRLSKNNDNHFGMKCFSKSCKKGHCSNFSDDTHKDFFRKYNNAWESYRAHSILLQGDRYKHLKKLGNKNYKEWATGLKKAGYATDKKYADKLIKIIEVMNLTRYDK